MRSRARRSSSFGKSEYPTLESVAAARADGKERRNDYCSNTHLQRAWRAPLHWLPPEHGAAANQQMADECRPRNTSELAIGGNGYGPPLARTAS